MYFGKFAHRPIFESLSGESQIGLSARAASDLLNLLNKMCTEAASAQKQTHTRCTGWDLSGLSGGEGGVTSKMSTWLAFLCLSSNELPPLHRDDSSLWDDSDDTESLKLWVKVQRMPGFKLEFFLFQISEDYFDHWSGGWIPLPLICPGQRHAPTECWHDNKM